MGEDGYTETRITFKILLVKFERVPGREIECQTYSSHYGSYIRTYVLASSTALPKIKKESIIKAVMSCGKY